MVGIIIDLLFFSFNLQLVSLGVIISAAVAIPAINQVKENTIYGYEDADSYRRAAGWLILLASVTVLYHIVVIIVRVLYMASVLKRHLRIYGAIVSTHDYINNRYIYSYIIAYYVTIYVAS